MARAFFEILLFFLAPFIAYALALAVTRRYPLALEHWSRSALSWLTLAGLAAAIAGVLWFGTLRGHETGAYRPAEFKDGKLVPGRLE